MILYHGTKADLKPGDLIGLGYNSNYGKRKKAGYVYLTATLNAATSGAELAVGQGRGRIYMVEPTGPIEDDPNLTDKKYPAIRRSHIALGIRFGSPAKSRIRRGIPPKSSNP
jgi:rifampin ADP-ribosylating transferase